MLNIFRSKRSDRNLWEVFQNQYRAIRLRTRSPSTVKAYEITLRKLDEFLERPALLSDLNDETIASFLDERFRHRAARTVNRDLTNLQALADWLWKKQIIDKTLTDLEPYTAVKLVPHALTMEEVNRVWASVNQQPGYIGRLPAPVFLRGLFLVFWDTAERFTAVTSIRVCDVNLKASTVFLRGETRKGGRGDRVYPLSEETAAAIDAMLSELGNVRRESKLFHIPYSKDKLWQILGEVMSRAGFPDDARHKTHLIRRTVATDLERQGLDASKLLDHARREITVNNYIDPRIAQDNAHLQVLSRPGATLEH